MIYDCTVHNAQQVIDQVPWSILRSELNQQGFPAATKFDF